MKSLSRGITAVLLLCFIICLSSAAYAAEAPVITKDPTGETAEELGYVYFISRADNAASIDWYLYSPNGEIRYTLDEAMTLFGAGSGVGYYFDNGVRENLVIYNLPYYLNGYSAACEFTSEDGSTILSAKAPITVIKRDDGTEKPVFGGQPVGAELPSGQIINLSATASLQGNGLVRYQWYKNTMDVLDHAEIIPGANSSFYSPEEITGTTYYYVAAWNENEGTISGLTFSDIVAVTYGAAEPSPEPEVIEQEQTEEPIQVEEEPAAAPAAAKDEGVMPTKQSNTKIIVTGIVICFAILAVCAIIIILKNGAQRKMDENEEDDFEVDPESYDFPDKEEK
ncbi:MAG: hypothetical protein MJ135_05695 [Oscillospiraceae bacterium]|nr:hypothetical protein [Oscillospiraceae bacterium]